MKEKIINYLKELEAPLWVEAVKTMDIEAYKTNLFGLIADTIPSITEKTIDDYFALKATAQKQAEIDNLTASKASIEAQLVEITAKLDELNSVEAISVL